jgi:competence protein ComEA
MRLRRLELAVIALTLAFICFMGGYFTGRKGSVNIVTVAAKQSEKYAAEAVSLPGKDSSKITEIAGKDTPKADVSSNVTTTDSKSANGNGAETGSDTTAGNSTTGGAETIQSPEIAGMPVGGDGKININMASQSELMDLPGIGGVLASRIIDYRRQHGGFSKIEDLRNVSGIGEKRYEAIRDQITVG